VGVWPAAAAAGAVGFGGKYINGAERRCGRADGARGEKKKRPK